MTTGWVPVFDQSFQRVPASRLHEMYAAGYRVMAGYAGGGSSDKWLTMAEIDAWYALGPDTGVAALFEITGTEPIDSPSLGRTHALAARAAWRARGYPDDCAISPAVDRNVSIAQGTADVLPYFQHWTAADTCEPIAYVEADVGATLKAKGASAGTFTPAAYAWNNPPILYTPANAPAHVLWTQEHNARSMAGGNVDVGHIRATAPIQWKAGADVALTAQDLADIADAVWVKHRITNTNLTPVADVPAEAFIQSTNTNAYRARLAAEANAKALAALPAAVVAELPPASTGGITPDQVTAAVLVALAKLSLTVTP